MMTFHPRPRRTGLLLPFAGLILCPGIPAGMADAPKAGSSPFIDQLKSELRDENDGEAAAGDDQWLKLQQQRLRGENADGDPRVSAGEKYIESLRSGLDEEDSSDEAGTSWLERERSRLRETEDESSGQSAIDAVKKGRSELSRKSDDQIRYAAGFHVAASTTRAVQASTSGGTGRAFESMYTEEMMPPVSLNFEYQPLRWNGVLSLGIGTSIDVSSHRGLGTFKVPLGDFGDDSTVEFRFVTLTTALNGVFRLDLIPGVQPWIAAGPVVMGYRESRNDDGPAYQGYGLGVRVAGGLSLRLDALLDSSAWDTVRDLGLNHIYLTASYAVMGADSAILTTAQESVFAGFTYEY